MIIDLRSSRGATVRARQKERLITQPPPESAINPHAFRGWKDAPPPQIRTPPQGTDGFAIASLVCGLVAGIVLSVIFGLIALVRIRKSGQGGRGLAIGGLGVSAVWLLVLVAAVARGDDGTSPGPYRDSSGRVASGGPVSAADLRTGDCVNGLKEGEVSALDAVVCEAPHDGEVFAIFPIGDGKWPGESTLREQVESGCHQRLAAYSTSAANNAAFEIFVLHPTQRSWQRGDRTVTCLVHNPANQLMGSVKEG